MRLLNVKTKELKYFIGSTRPPYAILSHTWGDDEVEFCDVKTSEWMDKRGYAKIDYTCRKAEQDKLQWCWIDTLCINKDSSAELSEAINSMYRWYSEAVVCYAYLEDVDFANFTKSLHRAKWFKRGWTLQELLAPKRVDFFSKEWIKLGTKEIESTQTSDFMTMVSRITEIDEMVLGSPAIMHSKNIATRMSWAYRRETTRQEDLAYCLMGLFDVNMPLLYGEGERAFIRLQEEIIKISDDQTIFAWDRDREDGADTVSFFAKSPHQFRRGALVKTFGRDHTSNGPFLLTNQGLQIRLPIYKNPGSDTTYALLNCHWVNTLTDCIGVPLRPTYSSEIFERSPYEEIETIALQDSAELESKTVFLVTRVSVKLSNATELSLQLYDQDLVDEHGFSLVEVIDPPDSSYHWHPDYYTFRMRWLTPNYGTSVEKRVCLMWRHDELDHNGLTLEFSCTIEKRAMDMISFKVRRMWFATGNPTSGTIQAEDYSADALTAETSIKNLQADGGSALFVTAKLTKRSIFGNEIYTLTVKTSDTSTYKSSN